MSRASSQQRFNDETNEYQQQQQQQQQPRSLSRNDSQRSFTEYAPQRQPDPLITTRIEESSVEPGIESIRKPSVTFKNDEYEQQSQNIQQMVEQRSSLYASPQYEEPQPAEYDYSQQQNMGYTYDQQQYEQPVVEPRYYQPESRRQSPEQEYQPFVEPQTPKRASPPKTPTRELSREEIDKIVQQRQQSREQLFDADELPQNRPALSSKQQSRDNLSESNEKTPSPPASQIIAPVSTTAPTSSITKSPLITSPKQIAPPSPKRATTNNSRNIKGGTEQKTGRNTLGEAAGTGRKSDNMSKQPPKVSNIRSKK
jgi:hypothetical protein